MAQGVLGPAAIAAIRREINTDDPKQLLYLRSDALLALCHLALLNPEVKEYRGCFFRKDAFEASAVDHWFQQSGVGPMSVEKVCNNVDLAYFFSKPVSDVTLLWEFAERLRCVWRVWLPHVCGRQVHVSVDRADTATPLITFWTALN